MVLLVSLFLVLLKHVSMSLGICNRVVETLDHLSIEVVLETVVEGLDICAERLKLRNDEVVAEDLGQEGEVAGEDVAELVKVQTGEKGNG